MKTIIPRPFFEKNLGQLPNSIKYKVKTNDYITYFTEEELIVSLPSNIKSNRYIFYMKLENKNNCIEIEGKDKQAGVVNYIIGNDETKWIKEIPTYSKIKYKEVYENIDLYYYINDNYLEYDFVLSKGANPKDICIRFEGIDNIEIDDDKNAILTIGDIKSILLKPEVYQIIDNTKVYVECEYILDNNQCIGFLVSEYEQEYELVLDPVLTLDYSTFIGGTKCDYATGIAVDSEGCVYISGYTEGDYPTTTGQMTYGGGIMDAFVTKMDSDGKSLIYSTYLGGSAADYANGIAIDSGGYAYVVGITESNNFPTTKDAYQTTYGGNSDVFVTKLNLTGSMLMYSTYIGSSSYNVGFAIAVDSKGYAYVTGRTEKNYPITTGAYQTTCAGYTDTFISKLDIDGSRLIYSTYIGGTDYDCGNGIAVDSEGCAYITGYAGTNYPTTKGAYQRIYGGDVKDAFVSKLSADGSKLIYSTYLGGSSIDQGNAITVDKKGYVYVLGYTQGAFPMMYPYQTSFSGGRDIFLSKLSIDGSELMYSTYIGSGGMEDPYSIVMDDDGNAYITGSSLGDAFVAKLNTLNNLLVSNIMTYDGQNDYGRGIAIDSRGNIYIAGHGEIGYQTTTDAYQTTCGGERDAIVSKVLFIDFDLSFDYKPSKVKLFDIINTKLIFKNLSLIDLDVKIKYQLLDESVSFMPNSIYIQGINKISDTIPSEIYLTNIPPQKNAEIELNLKNIIVKFPNMIPITVIIEIYDNRSGTPVLLYTKTVTFSMDTTIGPIYIPGCNNDLYNLKIDGELQTDSSGAPIIYYKYGTSYIYMELSENNYAYNLLSNPVYVVEYKII